MNGEVKRRLAGIFDYVLRRPVIDKSYDLLNSEVSICETSNPVKLARSVTARTLEIQLSSLFASS